MNIRNYCQIEGNGEPVVFVHGSFATAATWRSYTKTLSSNYQCISIKLPCHGAPALPRALKAVFSNDADFIEYVVSRITKKPISLIGHSYGATLCTEVALRGKLQVKRVILFDPVSVWLLKNIGDAAMVLQIDDFLKALHHNYATSPEQVCQQVIDFWNNACVFNSLPDHAKELMMLLVDYNIAHWNYCTTVRHTNKELCAFSIPCTIVSGARSHSIIHSISNHLEEYFDNAKHIVLPTANHFLVSTHKEDCLTIMQSDLCEAESVFPEAANDFDKLIVA